MEEEDDRIVLIPAADRDELFLAVDADIGLFFDPFDRIDEVGQVIDISLGYEEDRCAGQDYNRQCNEHQDDAYEQPAYSVLFRLIAGPASVLQMA